LRETKRVADAEIATLEMAMEAAQDSAQLRGLAQRLEEAVRRARRTADGLADLGAPVVLAEDDLDRRIHAVLARLDADTYSIPPRFRREVVGLIDAYMRSSILTELRHRERSLRPIITRELEAFGLPEELRYLAWVESNMVPSQVGRAGARGLWQFPPELARAYGLRVDVLADERTDPVKSTRAAAHHLADLFAEFGGDATLLAVVSYNLGEGKMRGLLREIAMEKGSWRTGQRSYWHLYRMRRFSPEVTGYVATFIAVALLDGSTP
jgi:membrane-bound lytic murein transglycosylase D